MKVAVCVKKHGSYDACRVRAREGGSRAARDGEEGRGGRHVVRHREPRVQIVRIHSPQDTHARSASKECHLACVSGARRCVECGWIRDGVRTPVETGSACRCARTSAYRWERGVHASQRCEDGIAEYAQVMLLAARDTFAWTQHHGLWRGPGWGGRSESE
jgi:hypothetical protein